MGIVSNLAEKMGGGTPVDAARLAFEKAGETLAAEEKRIEAASGEIEKATDELRATNPDGDGKAFARLVQERDTARGRLEAYQARRQRMVDELSEARQALAAAELAEKRAEVSRRAAEIQRRGGALTAAAHTFAARVASEQASLRELSGEVDRLVGEIRAAGDQRFRAERASRWVDDGGTPLECAERIVRETAP